MESREFSLTYRGPALEEGRIPVRDLAPALIALGDLFQVAREVAEPDAPPVHLEVRAFDDGSFKTALVAVIQGIGGVLLSDPASALSNLISIIGDAELGVFAVLKRIKGRITGITHNKDGSTVITTANGDIYNFPNAQQPVFRILEAPRGRDAARTVLEPLRKEGLEEAEIDATGAGPLTLTAAQADTLDRLDEIDQDDSEIEPIIEQVVEAVLIPLQPTLDPRYMARFQMGEQVIRARIEDEVYWGKLRRHEEGYLEGDTMRVRLRMRQWPPDTGKSIEWAIVEVLRHSHPASRAIRLPFEPDDQPLALTGSGGEGHEEEEEEDDDD
ncbi:MAG TPA: hypothetical protein VG318_10635 [Actinomycetota bacterium]|nr:hypothetical protein [Actinomycetota bacterium]